MDPLTDPQLEQLRAKAARAAAIAAGAAATETTPAIAPSAIAFGPTADGSGFQLASPLPSGGEQLALVRDLAGAAPALIAEIDRLRALMAAAVPRP